MGTIRDVPRKDGSTSFHAEVRLKGYTPQRASFRTRSLAKKWIQDTESAIRDGRHFRTSESKKHTVSDLIDRYGQYHLPNKVKTVEKQKALLSWWKKRLGHLNLADLTPAIIAEGRDVLLSEKTVRGSLRSPSTVNRYLASLSSSLTAGVKEFGWLEDNPMRKVSKPSEGKGRDRLLSIEEKDRLLAACKSSTNFYLSPIVNIAILTGMRFGEIARLQWQDIDFKEKAITLWETKNGDVRVLPLTRAVEKILDDLRKTDIVFGPIFAPTHRANKTGHVNIRNAFIKALKVANIDNFRFHDLRHAAASFLAMNGATQGELMTILGHRSPSMTRRYAHYSRKHLTDLMERMHSNLLTEDSNGIKTKS